jgi:hypothetical protein
VLPIAGSRPEGAGGVAVHRGGARHSIPGAVAAVANGVDRRQVELRGATPRAGCRAAVVMEQWEQDMSPRSNAPRADRIVAAEEAYVL